MDVPTDKKAINGHVVPKSFVAGDVVLSGEPWVCAFKYRVYKHLCAYCFKESHLHHKLMMCTRCELHYYCDKDCQAADWKKDHKNECKMLKEMNANIQLLDPCVEKEYCGEFGFCTAEILMAKIVNKIKSGKKEKLTGLNGEMTARDVLELLHYDPYYEKLFKLSDRSLHGRIWPTATLGSIPAGFHQLARKVYYNAFPIRDLANKERLGGAGLFPWALHRQMTPVCWDINVTMDLLKRTLVVHATEDIAHYTGLKDLRQNEVSVNIFATALPERQLWAKNWYFCPCICHKCTKEYDAEINPLKCPTTGCNERIPSDHRALQPCSQRGAINDQRMRQLKALKDKDAAITEVVKNVEARVKFQYDLLLELDRADIVHLDAHFRYVLGHDVLRFLIEEMRYEEAWNLCPGMVNCVRTIYPKYHLGRAGFLRMAGEIPCAWYLRFGLEGIRSKWNKDINAKVLDWLSEARDIYRCLAGPDNRWERHLTRDLHGLVKITMQLGLGARYHVDADLSGLRPVCQVTLRRK